LATRQNDNGLITNSKLTNLEILSNNPERKETEVAAALDLAGDCALVAGAQTRTGPRTNLTPLGQEPNQHVLLPIIRLNVLLAEITAGTDFGTDR